MVRSKNLTTARLPAELAWRGSPLQKRLDKTVLQVIRDVAIESSKEKEIEDLYDFEYFTHFEQLHDTA